MNVKSNLLSRIVLLAGAACLSIIFLTSRSALAAEFIAPPTISISPDLFYPLEEMLYVEGRTAPDAVVTVLLQKHGDTPLKFETRSDAEGGWSIARRVPLPEGYWELRAKVRDVSNNDSDWSPPRVVRSIETGWQIAGFTVKFSFLAGIILLILLGGVSFFVYSLIRLRQVREDQTRFKDQNRIQELEKTLRMKEIAEAQKAVESGFFDIKRQVFEELKSIDDRGSSAKLTPQDLQRKDELLTKLRNIETKIEKEIGDLKETP